MSDSTDRINHDLIRQYAAGASDFGQRQLLTLFDSLRRQEQQAAELSRAYLVQLCKLQQEVSALRAGAGAPAEPLRSGPPIARQKKLPQAPSPKAAPASAAEVSLDDL